MQKLTELIGSLQRRIAQASDATWEVVNELRYLNSSLTSAPESSPTHSAESAGDGSAPQTTGLTDAEVIDLCLNYGAWVWGGNDADITEKEVRELIWRVRSNRGLSLSAIGGPESQPRPLDALPDNSPGESCAATLTAEHSVPTLTKLLIGLREALRSAGEQAYGIQRLFSAETTARQGLILQEVLRLARMSADL